MKHKPFNGDYRFGEGIQKLVEHFTHRAIIETGMWSAHTTREFAKFVPRVFTIDATDEHLLEEFGTHAVTELETLNIDVILGDSSEMLPKLLKSGKIIYPVLLYLDAHGGA